jgi:dienelactone hydrolase
VQEAKRWSWLAIGPAAAGLAWLARVEDGTGAWRLLGLLPAAPLIACAVGALLFPGDRRLRHILALASLVSVLFAAGPLLAGDFGAGAVLALLGAASFLCAGALSLEHEAHAPGVPPPVGGALLAAQVAVDDALLGMMGFALTLPRGDDLSRGVAEQEEAVLQFGERGLLADPAAYHMQPPPLERPGIRPARCRGIDYEHLEFDSGWEPSPDEPGRDRWLSYGANRTAHAWVLRQREPGRPWLMLLHGYQMGWPLADLSAFQVDRLHAAGWNLMLPVLPLHGPRRKGRVSGDGWFVAEALDTVHAAAQAMWDLRRLLGWARSEGAARVGVYGLSLGGYHTALLAALEGDLACALAGIPASDVTRLVWRHAPSLFLANAQTRGLTRERSQQVLRVVSPLALPLQVPKERCAIFGATADQLVPPDQVHDLWEHWQQPRIAWYPGSHVTFMAHAPVRQLVREVLSEVAAG